ncbi:MAG TPA: GNAT family N-acetyltransferase [Actinomycetota bacterium]|nr:GNAT family N-acetyltransferase [Actinomycetota bacterium]
MPIPDAIRSYWYEAEALAETFVRTPWGVVVVDARYPLIFDANHAGVFEEVPDVGLSEIRAELEPRLRAVGATHEHIEFVDATRPVRAARELVQEGVRPSEDVLMLFEGPATEPVTDAMIEEVDPPDEAFWEFYRRSRNEFGETFSPDVVDQMVARDREVAIPAGLRFFAGSRGGEIAGFTSLMTLAGSAYIDNVVTLPEHRNHGVASATVTAAIAAAGAMDARALFLFAEEGGAPARLYQRLGFRVLTKAMGFTRPLPPV